MSNNDDLEAIAERLREHGLDDIADEVEDEIDLSEEEQFAQWIKDEYETDCIMTNSEYLEIRQEYDCYDVEVTGTMQRGESLEVVRQLLSEGLIGYLKEPRHDDGRIRMAFYHKPWG